MARRGELLPRSQNVRDARLVVIATEGEGTEPWYFGGLRDRAAIIDRTRLKIELLPAERGESSPRAVVDRLDRYDEAHGDALSGEDVRAVVLDVDRWPPAALHEVAQVAQERGWIFAVSNRCFEVWLLLHLGAAAEVDGPPKSLKHAWAATGRGGRWTFTVDEIARAVHRAAAADDVRAPIPPSGTSRVGCIFEALGLPVLAAPR